jgi:hypothetical protein
MILHWRETRHRHGHVKTPPSPTGGSLVEWSLRYHMAPISENLKGRKFPGESTGTLRQSKVLTQNHDEPASGPARANSGTPPAMG